MRRCTITLAVAAAAMFALSSTVVRATTISSYTAIEMETRTYNDAVYVVSGGTLSISDGSTVTFAQGLTIYCGGVVDINCADLKIGPGYGITLVCNSADSAKLNSWYGDFTCSNSSLEWNGITGLGNTWIRLRHTQLDKANHAVWQGQSSGRNGYAHIEYGNYTTDSLAFWFDSTRASGAATPVIKNVDIVTTGDGYADGIWVRNGSEMDIGAWGSWVDIEVSASSDSACGIYVQTSEPNIIQADVTGGLQSVWLYCADATLNSCVLDGNDKEYAGSAGLYVEGSDPTLVDCWLFGHDSTEIYLLPGCGADSDLNMIEGENGVHTDTCDGTGTPAGTARYAIYCGTGQDRAIDVSRNWWGCASPPFAYIFGCSGNVYDSDPNWWQPSFGRASRVARATSQWPDIAMFTRARDTEMSGDASGALVLYQNLINEYPDSPCAAHAVTRIRAAMLAAGSSDEDLHACLEGLLASGAAGVAERAEELMMRLNNNVPCSARSRGAWTLQTAPAQPGISGPAECDCAAIRFSPNPFNPTTTITYDVATAGDVEVSIFNVAGQLVRRLAHNPSMAAGTYSVAWDGTDDSRRKLASGVYLVRLTTPGRSVTERLTMAY